MGLEKLGLFNAAASAIAILFGHECQHMFLTRRRVNILTQ
jgi:hypothetical protein